MTDSGSGSNLVPPRDGRLTSEAIAERTFASSKRGYAESEVRAFLRRVADDFAELTSRGRDLEFRVQQLEQEARKPAPPLSDQQIIAALGEETARVLGQAREAAMELRGKAEEHARRLVKEAQDSVRDLRSATQQAIEQRTREAEDAARARSNEILGEARATRDRILADLSSRRDSLERQIVDLRAGRGKLVDAYELVERALAQVTGLMNDEQKGPAIASRPDVESPSAVSASEPAQEPTPDATPDATSDATAEDAVGTAVASDEPETSPSSEPAAESHDVGALFKQLRTASGGDAAATVAASPASGAEKPDATTEEAVAQVASDETGDDGGEPHPPTGDEALLAARDDALREVSDDLVRRAKRGLQDEQNDVLDGVRRQRGKINLSRVLPPADDQLARWAHVLQPAVDRAYAVGATSVSAATEPKHAPTALLSEITESVVTPLRDRLTTTLGEIDEPTPADTELAIAQRLGARYREWRLQQLEPALGDALASAHARGVYDSVPDGARMRWIPARLGKCPDCDDNALEPTEKGKEFPTGQVFPPAHPGCRCLLTVDVGAS